MMVPWSEFEEEAPEIARAAHARVAEEQLALLGTLRRDGSPRISPIEPHVAAGRLLFAAMRDTAKEADLLRDPRCVLHSLVTDPEGGAGEAKLYGRAEEVEDDSLRDAPAGAWWVGRRREAARVFSLALAEAAFVSWDTAAGELLIRSWSSGRGVTERRRPYP
jgi:hypothetical protein